MQEIWNGRKGHAPGFCFTLFFAGLLAGVLFAQTQKDAAFAGIFSEYFLSQYAILAIDYKKLLQYVGGYRCGQYILLSCCGLLPAAPALLPILSFVFGMTWGTMASISTLRLGLKGLLVCAAGLLPQMFFYIPAFGWIPLWIWNRGCSRKKYMFFAGAGFFFLFFGIITEVYMNPPILQQILRKL